MKIKHWAMGMTLAIMTGGLVTANDISQVTFCGDSASCDAPACGCGEPVCGCEATGCDANSCQPGGCDSGFGCDGGCDGGCGLGLGSRLGSRLGNGSLLGDCCLGDPWSLKEAIAPCFGIDFGGWTQAGYHSNNTPLSSTDNDALAFNDHPERLNLHQQWLWAEKVADGSCGLDWGFRADFMYGTDASKTQSFGNRPGSFDYQNGWDRGGGYGFAMPQLYLELASGDWSVIAGHFYTLVGYEVVTAPDNFFYSHALTMFNSEPFTHTGALATYSGISDLELYGGWTAGWNTGFDSLNSGSNFLGGFNATLSDSASFTYITTMGNFGARSGGENGYSHSMVLDLQMTDKLNYVIQSDLVGYDDTTGAGGNDQVGINQYSFYTVSDCLSLGSRSEWWKTDGVSYYGQTYGFNYKPQANLTIRPELRYVYTPTDAVRNTYLASNGDEIDDLRFGIDAVLTF